MKSERTEEYLEAISKRQRTESPVTNSSLAEDLGVSLPAVTDMMRRLSAMGLIDYQPNRGALLTPEGRRAAMTTIRRHRLWERVPEGRWSAIESVLRSKEDVGYTARVAFITDRYMHAIGLHGKSSLPLLLGFGCNVPAVMGSRIIESRRARILTILAAPLIPCTGRMAVIAVIAGAVFGGWAMVVIVGMVAFSLLVLAVLGLFMNRFVLRGSRAALLMEVPLYHAPNARTISLGAWPRSSSYPAWPRPPASSTIPGAGAGWRSLSGSSSGFPSRWPLRCIR